ncbi:MAG: tRNA (guanosine(46)-N7)-methyltransferase TrmB [Thiotrichales bacterium]|nr:tRNA (guanosine(46)-N7)-methyltransferase TrmB [Thiotrichales bacterium]
MTEQTTDTANIDNTETKTENALSDNQRRIKSFVLRQGRMSQSQQRSMENNWPKFGLDVEGELLDFDAVFGREGAPTIVEIGFGMGASLAAMAEANPQQNYIGIEVHRPGVGALLKLIEEKGLTNIRVFNHDAIEVLEKRIPKNSLAGVYLFFPDPWHKKRHNKRRIVQAEFAKFLASHIKPGGHFHMATDWEDYAEHMMEVMSAAPDYKNTQKDNAYTPRPDYRPLTKFEARGHRLGHGVWDLIFEKIEA